MLTKKEAENLMKIKGEVRGMTFKVDYEFILEEKGEEGLKKVEDRMAVLGYPLKYQEIKTMDFYPIGLSAIFLIVIKEVFNFNEQDLERWGRSVVKFSLIMKIFMKYFVSLELIAKQIPTIFRKHYTIGELKMPEYSEEKKYVILKLRNFQLTPIHCSIYKGYFAKTAEMVVKTPVTCKERKCMFRGDEYHEFLLTW